MSRKKIEEEQVRDGVWPSHTPFYQMIDFSVRGHSQPAFDGIRADDHIAELCMLMHGDIDDFLWRTTAPPEGIAMRKVVDQLTKRISMKKELAAAEMLYALATYATFEVLDLYLRNRELFDQITPRRALLPCLVSIHPNTARVTAEMARASRLGQRTPEAGLINSKAWFTSDTPANVYARAIITSVELNQGLSGPKLYEAMFASFDRKHGVKTRVLPLPKYIKGINDLPVPISPASVLQYWRKGKEIIQEELPDFHLRREWKNYHHRSYKDGAKAGVIQHAIFKDILAALRTIAGGNKAANKRESRKRSKPAS